MGVLAVGTCGVGAMMPGTQYFDNPLSLGAVRSWDSLLKQQADIFFPADEPFLCRYGMGMAIHLLDLGCGAGHYTDLVRRRFPNLRISAADTNPDFVSEYAERNRQQQIDHVTTLRWTAGQNHIPDQFRSCDTALLRLVLQHVADPLRILKEMIDFLPQGARVFILEEDDGFYCTEPNLPAFERVMDCWKALAIKHTTNRFMGREIPRLMLEAGFQLEAVEIVAHTNVTIGLSNMLGFFLDSLNAVSASDSSIVTQEQVNHIAEEMDKYVRKNEGRCLFNYPHHLVIGKKK